MPEMRLPRGLASREIRSVPFLRPLSEALLAARCLGHDPRYWDATEYPQALAALAICEPCTVKVECLQTVRPGPSWFDGVAGGIVFRNGYQVRRDNRSRGDRVRVDDGKPAV